MRALLLVSIACLVGMIGHAQPEPLSRPGIAIDTESALLVVFGGTTERGEPYGETWVFDLASGTWERRQPATSPPALHEHVIAYDAQSDLVVVWGGYTSDGENLELWAYDVHADTWRQVEQDPASIPPGRILAEAVYHPGTDRIVMNGGWDRATGPNLNDTWLLDVDTGTWEPVVTEPTPTTRQDYALAYDPQSGLILLYGGVGSDVAQEATDTDRVWAFDATAGTWVERDAIPGPTQTAYGDWAAIGEGGRLIFYGGGPFGSTEAWTYDATDHVWTALDAPEPGARHRHAIARGPDGDAWLFGGIVGFRSDNAQNDVWRFDAEAESWTMP